MADSPDVIAGSLSEVQRDVLLELALLINKRQSVTDVYATFLERMSAVAAFDFSALLSVKPDGSALRVLGRYPSWEASVPVGGALPAGAVPCEWLMAGSDGVEFTPAKEAETEVERRLANRHLGRAWGATLAAGETLGGLLLFARRDASALQSRDIGFFRAAGHLLSAALVQDSLLRQAEQDAVRGQLLHELAVLLNAGEPVAALFERILALTGRAIQLEYVALAVSGEEGEFQVVGVHPPGAANVGAFFGFGQNAQAHEILSSERVFDLPAGELEGTMGPYFRRVGVARALFSALREGRRTVGMLVLGRSTSDQFAEDEREFAGRLATILGQAIANERRISVTRAAAARARALNELAVLVNDGEPLAALFDRLAALLAGTLEFDYLGIGQLVGTRRLRVVGARPALLGPAGTEVAVSEATFAIFDDNYRAAAHGINGSSPAGAIYGAAGITQFATATLRDGLEMIGTFTVARKRDTPYPEGDLEFVSLLGTMLGQSIAAYRRTERALAEAARNRLLTEVALLVNAGEPADRSFDQLRELLAAAVPFDSMALLLPAPDGLNLEVAGSLRARTFPLGTLVPIGDVVGEPPTADGSYVVEYVPSAVASPAGQAAAASGVQRAAVTVLRQGSRLLGVLSLGRDSDRPFSPAEIELLQLLATFLSQSLANEWRLRETRLEGARSQLLSEVAVLLNDGKPTAEVFARVVDLMHPILPWDRCALLLMDSSGRDLVAVAAIPSNSVPLGTVIPFESIPVSPERWAARPSLVFHHRELALDLTQRVADLGGVLAAATALRDGERILGLFSVGRDSDVAFTPADLGLLEFLATLLARSVAAEQRIAASEAEAARATLLNQLGLLLNAGEAVETLFDRLPSLLARAIDFNYAGLAVEAGRAGYLRAVDWNSREPGNAEPIWVTREALQIDTIPLAPGSVVQLRLTPGTQPEGTVAAEFARLGLRRSAVALLGSPERRLGILHLARANAERFREEEMAFLEVVATFFSQAVSNQARIMESATEAEEQRLIAEVAAVAAAETDPGALISALRAPLRRLVPRPFVAFGYLEGEEAVYPVPGAAPVRVPLDRGSRAALKRGQVSSPEPPEDLARESRIWSAGVHALANTVAHSGGSVVGFLLAGSRQKAFLFEARELRILKVIAQIAGPALENARAVERARIEAEEQRILAELAAVAAREPEPMVLLNGIVEPLRALVPRPFIAYGHLEGDEAVWPTPGGEVRLPFSGGVLLALKAGQWAGPLWPVHPDDPARDVALTQLSYTAALSGGVAFGMLEIATREPGFVFGERELRLFKLIAQIVGPAMENARSAKRAQADAVEQRILAEAASGAALGSSIAEITGALPAALAALVPGAFAMYGRLVDDTIIYDTVTPEVASIVCAGELALPLSATGREAREQGQGQGSLAWAHGDDSPEGWPHADDARIGVMRRVAQQLGLYQYCLLPYRAAGAPVGMLLVASRDPAYVFPPAHLALLSRVAQIAGPAIEAVRAAANIARQGALYDLILRSLTEGVILLDREGERVFANRFGTTLLDSVSPEGFDSLISRGPEGARAGMVRTLAENVVTGGRTVVTIDGEERWVDYELVPLDDAHSKLLIVASDVTAAVRRETEEREQRDQLAQASRLVALGELVGGVAHELNNPLTAVLGFSEILAQAPEAAALSEEIGIIQKEALRARNIVRDLLFIARPAPVEHAEVALGDVVGHIERLRRAAWARAGIRVEIAVAREGCQIWGNENQLAQVLLNLISNAEYALPHGGEIAITGRRAGANVQILVSDNGPGMPPEVAARVFEPFFTTKQTRGTGLGLSLSRGIVLSHGGAISVESVPGEGTTFTITLPAQSGAKPDPPPAVASAPRGPARVLVIDDEPSLRKVCQRLIVSMGHQCSVADGSVSALALVAAEEFDVVLCDYRLAAETANAVVAAFVAGAPQMVERMVIATGATTDPGVMELTERFGLRLVAKPYGGEELAGIIAEASARAHHA